MPETLTTHPVRIGCVAYLNTLPLIDGLRLWRDARLVPAVPSRLIDMLLGGEVDVALCSTIDAARYREQVTLLPVGMIGCDGPTYTVRLFSAVPIQQLTRVRVDAESHTSVALLQVLLARRFGVRVEVEAFDAASLREDSLPEAMLLIGDKIVTSAPSPERYPHQLDLGLAWKEVTGLPFAYAVWMCRAGEEETQPVQAAAMMLDRQRRHNATRLDRIVAEHAGERGWPRDLAAKYVGEYLHYAVDEPEREAVDKFLRWSAELGLCPAGEPRWAGETVSHH